MRHSAIPSTSPACTPKPIIHGERNHQGLDNRLINTPSDVPDLGRAIERKERLGGILNYYYRQAA